MIVVADTSPINYLVQIELDSLLQQLYDEIVLPLPVLAELQDNSAPEAVRQWASAPPAWVQVRKPILQMQAELIDLDAGERAAIEVALDLGASILLLDERKARTVATRLFGFTVIGTLGIIREGHQAGLVDGRQAYHSLCAATNFYRSEQLERIFLSSLS